MYSLAFKQLSFRSFVLIKLHKIEVDSAQPDPWNVLEIFFAFTSNSLIPFTNSVLITSFFLDLPVTKIFLISKSKRELIESFSVLYPLKIFNSFKFGVSSVALGYSFVIKKLIFWK